MGVGIHGEPGRERMKMKQASEIVDMMATAIVDDLPFGKGDPQVLAFVNGMGGGGQRRSEPVRGLQRASTSSSRAAASRSRGT